MVKGPTENSVPVLKGAAVTELKIGDLPIVFSGLISQASCLEGHSFHTVSRGHRICCLHVNTKPMYPSSGTLQFQFGFLIALCSCF